MDRARETARASNRQLRKLQLGFRGAHPIHATIVRRLAGHRTTPGFRSWKADPQPVRLNLEQSLGVRKAGEAMATETAEPDDGRHRLSNRCSGCGRNDDLSAMGSRAEASGRVDGHTDVPRHLSAS